MKTKKGFLLAGMVFVIVLVFTGCYTVVMVPRRVAVDTDEIVYEEPDRVVVEESEGGVDIHHYYFGDLGDWLYFDPFWTSPCWWRYHTGWGFPYVDWWYHPWYPSYYYPYHYSWWHSPFGWYHGGYYGYGWYGNYYDPYWGWSAWGGGSPGSVYVPFQKRPFLRGDEMIVRDGGAARRSPGLFKTSGSGDAGSSRPSGTSVGSGGVRRTPRSGSGSGSGSRSSGSGGSSVSKPSGSGGGSAPASPRRTRRSDSSMEQSSSSYSPSGYKSTIPPSGSSSSSGSSSGRRVERPSTPSWGGSSSGSSGSSGGSSHSGSSSSSGSSSGSSSSGSSSGSSSSSGGGDRRTPR